MTNFPFVANLNETTCCSKKNNKHNIKTKHINHGKIILNIHYQLATNNTEFDGKSKQTKQ